LLVSPRLHPRSLMLDIVFTIVYGGGVAKDRRNK
jgi:hypothetical protein